MAAFFTGVVRAPVTGIVLVAEMTGNVTMLLPMLGARFVAMLLPRCCATHRSTTLCVGHMLHLEQQIKR
jgi:CIC family chloride channel protein